MPSLDILETTVLDLIVETHQSNFQNKAAFWQALTYLETLRKQHPQHTRFLILQAYLLTLIDEPVAAIRALKKALTLSPNNTDALALLSHIQRDNRHLEVDHLELVFKTGYESLLKKVLSLPKKSRLTSFKNDKEIYQGLERDYDALKAHQETLSRTEGCFGLSMQLDPLALALEKESKRLRSSERMLDLKQTIQSTLNQVTKAMKSPDQLSEKPLECWVAKSNLWADQIEIWQVEGHDTNELEGIFSQYVSCIQALMDWLDEA